MANHKWRIVNPSGSRRIIVTKELPGSHWLEVLEGANCRIEICTSKDVLTVREIKSAIDSACQGAIGQLTEDWGTTLFSALKTAGGKVYSNYAVGYNNVDVAAATKEGIPVGNTPGVLTETTAEMAVTLTLAAARRLGEAERYLRKGNFKGWLPNLFVGELLNRKTVGIIGAGRIGSAYARIMAEGFKMNIIYFDLYPNSKLESYIASYNEFLVSNGESPLWCKRADSPEELLKEADCVSIHTVLDDSTHHLINSSRLALMKENAILVNTSRGPVIDENALVNHARNNPGFKAGLDVFENEPKLARGLSGLENVVIAPHIASATQWTRAGMASLAACNVAGILQGYPVRNQPDIRDFLKGTPPQAVPNIINAKELNLPMI